MRRTLAAPTCFLFALSGCGSDAPAGSAADMTPPSTVGSTASVTGGGASAGSLTSTQGSTTAAGVEGATSVGGAASVGGATSMGGMMSTTAASAGGASTTTGSGGSGAQGGGPTVIDTPASFDNPVIPGFHPDPSVCQVGEDYYLANSSFEYFPGVPIFHSRDLVNWRQIGNALTRDQQAPLQQLASSQGIYAPSLRYHDGTFYMITTNVSGDGHLYVTATDPAGPWSDAIWINDSGGGIDPDLFFDDDGTVYFTRHGGGESGGIYQAEIDIGTGQLANSPTEIWSGTGGIWPEGPHLYKIDGSYYLMIAEGGTWEGHQVTIARSDSPTGPFESYTQNPILSHPASGVPIQATGHGDLVQAPNGSWWMVFLGIRQWDDAHHHLGRETFLAPVVWNSDGWPEVNGGSSVELSMPSEGLPSFTLWPEPPPRNDFDAAELGVEWNHVRNPVQANYSLAARPGFLRLSASNISMDDVDTPTFVGRRQEHFRASISTRLEVAPTSDGQEAGLVIRMNEDHHYDLLVTRAGGVNNVALQTRVGGTTTTVAEATLEGTAVTLSIEAYEDRYEFFHAADGGEPVALGEANTTNLSSEVAGGFTGVYIGPYAARRSGAPSFDADFDWFEYAAR